MTTDPKSFAARLRRARDARGMTQEQAAASMGTTRVSIARWEVEMCEPKGIARTVAEQWIAASLRRKGGRHAR